MTNPDPLPTAPLQIAPLQAASLQTALSKAVGAAPGTYLFVGDGGTFAETLALALPRGGRAFVHGDADAGPAATAPLPGVAEARITGPLVGAADHPALAEVIAFAFTRANARAVVASFTRSIHAAAQLGDRDTALAQLARAVEPADVDLVVIDGEPVLGGEVVKRTWGARAFLVSAHRDTFGGAAAFEALFASRDYTLAASEDGGETDWALFVRQAPQLPIHFFTIVLNGDPFIRYHEQVFASLPFDWHWHIVEGVAELIHDTAWSVANGGQVPADLHRDGISNDGTSEYLDALAAAHPDRITLYRTDGGRFWAGKLEMVNAPLRAIEEDCLLWQVDADELWTAEQIVAVRDAFLDEPDRTAAWFWCNYYVGPDRGISTRYSYAQNPNQEWLRVWRFAPGMVWEKHEPPVLQGQDETGAYDVGRRLPFWHRETEAMGAVFDHFAYATEAQARFKESYYGYAGAVAQWRALQQAPARSIHLRDYMAWVTDETMIDTVERLGWAPVATVDPTTGGWRFAEPAPLAVPDHADRGGTTPTVVVDGVFFQLSNSGIARVWANLLAAWCRSGFGDHVVLLDRGGTAPRIDGVRYHSIEPHSWSTIDGDANYLQEVCDRLGASLFLSTYYTTPTRTPSIFFGHDMIPETLGFDLDDVWWRQKRRAIQHAAGHIMVSGSSAAALARHFPEVPIADILVAPNSVDPVFRQSLPDEVAAFRRKYDLPGELVMMVGERVGWKGYKNGLIVFAALAGMDRTRRPLLVCVGGADELEGTAKALLDEDDVRLLKLDDDELRLCYAASLAYVCPSLMEGFGLPILEAMTVGTPALVCRNSSIPEVAGDAGVYFDANDPLSLAEAIEALREPETRRAVIAAGHRQAARFDQDRTARLIADHCLDIAARPDTGRAGSVLADAFEDAEAARAAHVGLQATERRIVLAKASMAAASRALELVQEYPDDAEAPIHIAEAVNAIGRAYGGLRNTARPLAFFSDNSQSAGWAEEGVSVSEMAGLSRIEGPYPHFGMFRPFRWQVDATSTTTFLLDRPMDAWLEIEFGNVQDNQGIVVALDGHRLHGFHPDVVGWDHIWRVRLPVSLEAGLARVSLSADAFNHSVHDGRSLYIAIYGIRLIRREARGGDAATIIDLNPNQMPGKRRDAFTLEVPAERIETTGLAVREGPYPDFGITRAFQWQTEEASRYRYSSDDAAIAWLQVTFSNVEPGQSVSFHQGDTLLYSFAPPSLGWGHQWRATLPVELDGGATEFSVHATHHHAETEADGRRLHIGIYDLRLLVRSPKADPLAQIVDLSSVDDRTH